MLTIQFVPHMEIQHLNSIKRINKILTLVKQNKIVLLEGKLKSHEETELIAKTMEEIDSKFKGIEISVMHSSIKENTILWDKIKEAVLNFLLGDRKGFTIIGPANIIKEIKQDPEKIQLLLEEASSKKKKGD
ncbi:MAG: DUF2073 domain-containing protein [Nanoarchaeota archaeon]|nr:DUF2073 domain-containing protein [Nanoarchaeota archaeon]MBU1029672.1 DUF2073 domain-containing protein [Nanoarchaeota archaeon]MBU1849386.1 DUF2073 domain-containing protein [Nanoarchaeota archaeon]